MRCTRPAIALYLMRYEPSALGALIFLAAVVLLAVPVALGKAVRRVVGV